jgi:hypothetical protein
MAGLRIPDHTQFARRDIITIMEKDGERVCDGCGRPIPKKALLATKENGRDLCLACQIRDAQITKGLRH